VRNLAGSTTGDKDNPMLYATLNVLALCIALAAFETLHGIVRAAILVPRVGKKSALRISIFSGSILAFLVCYYFVPKIGSTDTVQLLGVGLVAALFMALFDVSFARVVLKRPLASSLRDFNPATGNYLIYGLLFLIVCPLLVMNIRAW
jgi:hypothetical protein